MSLKVYQIRLRAKKPSFFNRAGKSMGELPLGTKILTGVGLAAGAIALAPFELPIVAGAAATGTTALLASGVVALFGGDDDKIDIISDATEMAKFKSDSGEEFSEGDFYISHPLRPYTLMVPSTFHERIVHEQISELIAYLRSRLAVTKIRIEVSASREGKAGVKVPTPQGGIQFSFMENRSLFVEVEERDPALVPISEKLIWLSKFPTIKNSVEGAKSGSSTFQERQDMAFGLKGEFAKRIGIDATWLTTQNFTVRVEYGKSAAPRQE